MSQQYPRCVGVGKENESEERVGDCFEARPDRCTVADPPYSIPKSGVFKRQFPGLVISLIAVL
jgi:hypothetical protein